MSETRWEFTRPAKNGKPMVMITVELEDNGLGAIADDDYYNGTLSREEAVAMARAILAKFEPVP